MHKFSHGTRLIRLVYQEFQRHPHSFGGCRGLCFVPYSSVLCVTTVDIFRRRDVDKGNYFFKKMTIPLLRRGHIDPGKQQVSMDTPSIATSPKTSNFGQIPTPNGLLTQFKVGFPRRVGTSDTAGQNANRRYLYYLHKRGSPRGSFTPRNGVQDESGGDDNHIHNLPMRIIEQGPCSLLQEGRDNLQR